MTSILYGLAALAALWWFSRVFANANPSKLALVLRRIGALGLLAASGVLFARGRFDIAVMVAAAAAWLGGWNLPFLPPMGRTKRTPGAVSRVRSALLEMELSHDTGEMTGTVLAGRFAGRSLSDIDVADLRQLHADCASADPDGMRLLEAYFDRRFPGWRQDAQGDRDPGPSGKAKMGAMTEEEAYEVLGLQPGASLDEIRRAHRLLMKKLHPDQGGSTYLASRVNAAKDVLLNRHR